MYPLCAKELSPAPAIHAPILTVDNQERPVTPITGKLELVGSPKKESKIVIPRASLTTSIT